MAQLFSSDHEHLIARLAERVSDARVLDAMRAVPRALFVPGEQRPLAYADAPLAIGPGDPMPAPMLVARMCEALELTGRERVLDVGTGHGYRAAVLSELCTQVVTVGPSPVLAERVAESLRRAGITNVEVLVGEPAVVARPGAPYDAVVLSRRTRLDVDAYVVADGPVLAPLAGAQRLLLTRRRERERSARLLPVVRTAQLDGR